MRHTIGRLKTADGYVWIIFSDGDSFAIPGTTTGHTPCSATRAEVAVAEAGWSKPGDTFEVVKL